LFIHPPDFHIDINAKKAYPTIIIVALKDFFVFFIIFIYFP
jgi:hypothetical protein